VKTLRTVLKLLSRDFRSATTQQPLASILNNVGIIL